MALFRQLRTREGTFVPGWSVSRVWRLSLAVCAGVLLVGLLAAPWVDLAGLLVAGPCCALLTGRWVRTAATALLAVAFAVVLGFVGGAGEAEQIAFVAAVGLVGLANTAAAALIQQHIDREGI
jgi:hypothetical protein